MSHTTFIVGAGTSVDFGFPTGPALQGQIIQLLRPSHENNFGLDPRIVAALPTLERYGLQLNEVIDLCNWIAKSLPLAGSIDSFLEVQSNGNDALSFLGKYAISLIISKCERISPLIDRSIETAGFEGLSDSWIGKLWRKANKGGSSRSVESPLQGYSFVSFNYDRCVEQFLLVALMQYYRISLNEALKYLETIDIFHVYGSLGAISNSEDSFKFGFDHDYSDIIYSSTRIKTFSEQIDSQLHLDISNVLENSDRIVFLGFSFANMNTTFLQSTVSESKKLRKVFGTSYQMSNFDTSTAESWCDSAFRGYTSGSRLSNVTASQFFDNHQLLF